MSGVATDAIAVVATIDPDAYAANTYTSDWVDMGDFHLLMAVVQTGTLGASATVAAKLQQATDSSGTGAKDVTGKAITTLTQASPDDSDKQAVINVRANELDLNNNFRYVNLSLTVAVAASDVSAVLLGFIARYDPTTEYDLSTVSEIVT